MNLLFKISFAFLITTQTNYSQEQNKDSLNNYSNSYSKSHFQEEFLYDLENFNLYLDLHNSRNNIPLNKDPNTQWLWTKAILSNFNQSSDQQTANLNNMLSLQYGQFINDSKFNPFRYALGMAQLGAVGYLAYKHIKKYGFR